MTRLVSPRLASAALLGCAALSLAACADEPPPPYAYGPYEAGAVSQVRQGVVVSSRPVEFGPHGVAEGAILGGAGGAVVGSALAGRGSHGEGAVLGLLGGALLGSAIQSSQHTRGFAYTIQRPDGGLVEIAQADPEPIPNGTRVAVAFGPYGRARVTPLRPGAPPPPNYGPGPGGPPPGYGYGDRAPPPPPPPPPGA